MRFSVVYTKRFWQDGLAGRDDRTGIDDSFRREWIRRRMEALASVFGIDVQTYAITGNHAQLPPNGMVKLVAFCAGIGIKGTG